MKKDQLKGGISAMFGMEVRLLRRVSNSLTRNMRSLRKDNPRGGHSLPLKNIE